MIDASPLLGFITVSVIIILAPGSDVLLLIRSSLLGGRRIGFATFAGIHAGNLILTTIVASGLGAIVAHSHTMMAVIRVAGALYLFWLCYSCAAGALSQWRSLRGGADCSTASGVTVAPSAHSAFAQGLTTNVTNPKVLIFYLSFLPQFLGRADNTFLQMELLALVFILLAMMWEAAVVVLAARVRSVIERPMFGVILDGLSSLVFLVLGVFVLLETA